MLASYKFNDALSDNFVTIPSTSQYSLSRGANLIETPLTDLFRTTAIISESVFSKKGRHFEV